MSVINKVLKDLDKRGRQPFDGSDKSSAVAAEEGNSKRWLWWSLGGAGAVVALSFWGYRWLTPQSINHATQVEPYRPQSSIQPESEPQPVVESENNTQEKSITLPPQLELPAEQDSGTVQIASESVDSSAAGKESAAESEPVFVKQAVNLSPQQVALQHAEKAESAQQQGRLSDAESHWQNAVRVVPENLDYRKQLAALQYGRGQISQALVTLNDGLKRQPTAHSLRLLSAKILQKEGQLQAALLLLNRANPTVLKHLEYYQLQAQLAQQLEQYERAAQTYSKLAQAQPNNGRWHLGQAIALEQIDGSAAIAVYKEALKHLTHKPSIEFVQNRLQQLSNQPETP